ncbi:hypothetical protein P3S72_13330 [Pseudomonas sp. D3]|uniref:hypothetical protein n=1 Tax=Pseudomonas sp. D3 TaxID=517398 RepID=UPI0023E40A30|nr:hypothetical protein [Pseudomonas sp. D3]WET13064.1 hypothetical protein P3S72_13330 [Pseudomonas sp. D3]
MKRLNEEGYFFHYMYSVDFEAALDSIKLIKRYKRPDVKFALLRDVTVAYIRPFSKNRGRKAKHELGVNDVVPKHLRDLHDVLYKLRSEQFAHTDLTYYDPKSVIYGEGPTSLVYNGFSYEGLLARLPEIEELVKAVESVVIARIRAYEAEGSDLNHESAIRLDPALSKLWGLL